MQPTDGLLILCFFGVLGTLSYPLGLYIGRVLAGETHFLARPLGWLERLVYRMGGVNPSATMTARQYIVSLVIFHGWGLFVLLFIQMAQGFLPLNPDHLEGVPFWLAFNTAVSFVTNTNWQAYSGEVTLSHFSQMVGLGVQNFLSAATGLAVVVALARGIMAKKQDDLGNFWVDLTRSVVFILLPLSVLYAIVLMSQGVIQNFDAAVTVTTLEGAKQTLPMGPAASQIAIKQLGTNGGGFFGVNSTHPFENPTSLANFIEMLALLLIPVAVPFSFGHWIRNQRHGRSLFAFMSLTFIAVVALGLYSEWHAPFGLLEGKELRNGVTSSALWAISTTASSNGSVNAMHSSLAPLTGGLAMLNIMLGEIVFGGVGSGLYGAVLFALLAVFLAGLMVGRTPEYLGKKIEAPEIKLTVIGILTPSVMILCFAALACLVKPGLASILNQGPHGLSEILYAFSSAAGNNGSAFAGLNANTTFYNAATALCMLVGRFAVLVPVLLIAGNLARKKIVPANPGTFPTHGPLFVALLGGTALIVGALTFFPALCLGPIAEHFAMLRGMTF